MEVLGSGSDAAPGLTRRHAARADRTHAPVLPDPHLRWRHQRDSARHHRHGRARPAPGQSLRDDRRFHMDFSRTEASDDLGGLVRTITESVCTPEHQRELDGLDHVSTAICGPSSSMPTSCPPPRRKLFGGGGYGVLEQTAVLEALGRQLAAVPYLESAVLAAGALAKFGSNALQQDWAVPAIDGSQGAHRRTGRRHGRGTRPGRRPRPMVRVPADRNPHPGRLRTGGRRHRWCPPRPIRAPRCSSSPPTTPA